MDELLGEVKITNQLLRLAFGDAIEKRLASLARSGSAGKVVSALKDQDELAMDALQKVTGLPRSSLYATIGTLERLGAIERGRRGYVALSKAAAPYIAGGRRAEATSE
jgi:hypothetical protein